MVDRRLLKQSSPTVGTGLFLLWGVIAWGLQFSAAYLAHTWLCRLGASEAATDWAIVAATALALAAIAPVAISPDRSARLLGLAEDGPDRDHLLRIARTIAHLSGLAALWTGLGAGFVEACALGR